MPDAMPPIPPAAPVPAKPSAAPKILIGCLGALALVGVLIGVGLWWVGHKVKQYADNPAALAALAVAGNPDLEVVSQDDDRKTVTIRNKKTGETFTMDASRLKDGKLELTNEKGEKLTFDGSEGGKGAMKVETKEGTTTFGEGGSAPAWVPAYPGASPEGTFAQKGEKGEAGAFTFQTADAVQAVVTRFESDLQGGGFKVEKTLSGEAMGVVAAKHGDGRQVNVTAMRNGDATAVTVHYQEKP